MNPSTRPGASSSSSKASPAALLPQLHAAWAATRIRAVYSRPPGYPRTDGANPSQEKMRAHVRRHGLPRPAAEPGFRAKVSPASAPAPGRQPEPLPEPWMLDTEHPTIAIVLGAMTEYIEANKLDVDPAKFKVTIKLCAAIIAALIPAEKEASVYTKDELLAMPLAELREIWTASAMPGNFPGGFPPVAKKRAVTKILAFQESGGESTE